MKTLHHDAPRGKACRRCGRTNMITFPLATAPHSAEARCAACGVHAGYVPKPWTRARAVSFTLPFGKYRGRSAAEVASTDPGYLRWLAGIDGNAAKAARVMWGIAPEEAT